MKKLLTNIATVFTLLLLNIFGLALHASAMPMTSHEMGGMNHEASSSTSCATLCRTAVFNKEEATVRVDEEENDAPQVPFYTQLHKQISSDIVVKSRLYAANVKPPPKIPIYLLYGVLRV